MPRALLRRHRRDLAHELEQVGAHALRADVRVGVEHALEAGAVVGELARRDPADQGALQRRDLALPHGAEARLGRGAALGRVVRLGARAAQHEEVVGGEVRPVEAERVAAGGEPPIQLGARPVGDGHEVVAEGLHPRGGHGADGALVVLDALTEGAGAGLDLLRNGDALHHRPAEASGLDLPLALRHLLFRPGLPLVEVVQRGHHAGRAGLPHVLQGHRVVGAEPAPGLFHRFRPFPPAGRPAGPPSCPHRVNGRRCSALCRSVNSAGGKRPGCPRVRQVGSATASANALGLFARSVAYGAGRPNR